MVELTGLGALNSTQPILLAIEALGRKHGGIQHWGMFYNLGAGDVAGAFLDLEKWQSVYWQLTDGGRPRTFESDFSQRCGLHEWRTPTATGWTAVPGGGRTNLPGTAVVFRDRLYLFCIGNDTAHYVNVFVSAAFFSVWSGWSQVPGGGTTSLADAAVVFRDRLYLFGIGNDTAHYVNVFDGTTWSGWGAVPGGGTTNLPDAAVVFQDRLYLIGIGNDNLFYMNVFDGTTWTGWTALPGAGATKLPPAAIESQGRLNLFCIGYDSSFYMNLLSSG